MTNAFSINNKNLNYAVSQQLSTLWSFFHLQPVHPLLAMIVLLTLAMLPVLLAQDQGKAETCSYLAGKISKLDDAITLSFCDLTGIT